jgi:hypothetical protein
MPLESLVYPLSVAFVYLFFQLDANFVILWILSNHFIGFLQWMDIG